MFGGRIEFSSGGGWLNKGSILNVYSHGGPIRHRKRRYILTTDQSDAGSAGIFARRTIGAHICEIVWLRCNRSVGVHLDCEVTNLGSVQERGFGDSKVTGIIPAQDQRAVR
eukprot:1192418-Prorocentrum_minimum.AAC.3